MPFQPYRYQADLWADESPQRIVLKARQAGISSALVAEALDGGMQRAGSLALFISRAETQAKELIQYGHEFAAENPAIPIVGNAETHIKLANKSRLLSLTAKPDAGRGFAADRVYLDEFAFAAYDGLIFKAVRPTLSRPGGSITVISTPNGRANMFYRIWAGLEAGEWSRHFVHWTACPRYDAAWEEKERPSYTLRAWAEEFDCDFTASGGARFKPDDIDALTDGAIGLQTARVKGHRYLTTWDIGRHHDATVQTTLDVTQTPYQLVAFQRFQGLAYPRIQNMIENVHRFWQGQTFIDSTGAGDPVLENLNVAAQGFVFSAKSKAQALDALSLLLEKRLLKAPYIRQMVEELIGYEDADKNLVQDVVMALGIAAAEAPTPSRGRILA
jgi:hypothetical protein